MVKRFGPQEPESEKVHKDKYRSPKESFRECISRIASVLTENPEDFQAAREILLSMRFLPGGRIQASVGSSKVITPYNCYVSGTIEDSFTAGAGSIMARAIQAADTMRMGGGIGYDFSTLRPRGASIKKLSSHSSGPIPFMDIFNSICKATNSSGARRGAQMGILRCDHPDIEEFIYAKQNELSLTGFNLSVGITDKFMEAVIKDKEFQLCFNNTPYRSIWARQLWDTLMRSTYDWAEPGVIFLDRINKMNNLSYCETIAATNPCGEQPLPPFGACLLGSFNLTQYLEKTPLGYSFDYEQLVLDIPYVVKLMDRVIDIARYPLYEQEQEALDKRRMGLGVTGLANTIEALGSPYGSKDFIQKASAIFRTLRDNCYEASAMLAKEKGSFPLFNKEAYLKTPFVQSLSSEVRNLISTHGIRNSHLLSIAPTGTISFTADNVSSGIEPVFAYKIERTVIEPEGKREVVIEDYGSKYLGTKGKTAEECTVDDHLNVLICATKYVDSAVSKTCNVPADIDWESFKTIYIRAWEAGCKGCTTYRKGGKKEGILKELEEPSLPMISETCEIDLATGRKNCE